jgi:hypothetical protein
MTVFALLIVSLFVQLRMRSTAQAIAKEFPTQHGGWVDEVAGGQSVTLVGGARKDAPALRLIAFWNLSVTRVYSTCVDAFGADFGERRLIEIKGSLRDGTQPIRARYVVAPASLGIRGRVIGRQAKQGIELVVPAGGVVQVARPLRCSAA